MVQSPIPKKIEMCKFSLPDFSRCFLHSIFSIVCLASLFACAHIPDATEPLGEAKNLIQHARANNAGKLAPNELETAEKEIARVDKEMDNVHSKADPETLYHMARVARTQSEIALVATEIAQNQKKIEDLQQEKFDAVNIRKQAADQIKSQQEMLLLREKELLAQEERLQKMMEEALTEFAEVQRTQRGLQVSFSEILFDYNRYDIKPGVKKNLKSLASILKEYPDRMILIEGHTDSHGNGVYNKELSKKRASSVESYLAKQGIMANNLRSRGYGETYPVATNDTREGRQQNRRVNIVVLDRDKNPAENFLDG